MIIDFTGIEAVGDFDLTPCYPACDDEDCMGCAAAECPYDEPLHRDSDGCPACDGTGEKSE